jgi:hypothetical protein
MANIKIADLDNHHLIKATLASSIQDLSINQLNLQGGMCVANYGESNTGGCGDVVIDILKFSRPIYLPKR